MLGAISLLSGKMKVLHINVRLTEGGAAKVALDLHTALQDMEGFSSSFGYGYSKGGEKNPIEQEVSGFSIVNKFLALSNLVLHKFTNLDVIPPAGVRRLNLENELNLADIVHIHALHSYFISFEWLIEKLISLKKKVVWTCHDRWAITGRCAITEQCNRWNDSPSPCWKCPQKTNYPSVMFDRASSTAIKKRQLIRRLAKNSSFCFVSPSKHMQDDIRSVFPEIRCELINNASPVKRPELRPAHPAEKTHVLIVAHDLSYPEKANPNIINMLLENKDVQLHTVGKNSPFTAENVVNHGYLASKDTLAEVYQMCNAMLFTSTIDNYPLVICESLISYLPVIAIESDAAVEVLSRVGARCAASPDEIIKIIENRSWLAELYNNQSLDDISRMSENVFSPTRMIEDYIDVYRSL